VIPVVANGEFHAGNVAHAASDGAIRVPNRRKPMWVQSNFSELRLKMCATVYARIQINVQNVAYVVKLTNHLFLLHCLNKLNKTI
jgi:hypothetical protein